MRLVHKSVELVCTTLRITLTETTNGLCGYNHFIPSDTSRLTLTNTSRYAIADAITATLHRTTPETTESFYTRVAATVSDFRYRARINDKGSISQFDFPATGIASVARLRAAARVRRRRRVKRHPNTACGR
jgi:hypothetical protein